MDSSNRLACPEWEGSEYDNADAVKVGGLSGSVGIEDANGVGMTGTRRQQEPESGAAGPESRGVLRTRHTKLGWECMWRWWGTSRCSSKMVFTSPSPLSALPRRRSPYDSASAKASGSPPLTRLPEAEAICMRAHMNEFPCI